MVTAKILATASKADLIRALRPFLEDPKSPAPTKKPGLREAWGRPSVAAARKVRDHVKVRGVEYRSTRAAFVALGLPLSKHIPFRAGLKAHGRAVFVYEGEKFRFDIVR